MFKINVIILSAALSIFSGGNDSLVDLANSLISPATQQEQREKAISGLVDNINNMHRPVAGVAIDYSTLEKSIMAQPEVSKHIDNVVVEGENQLIAFDMELDTVVNLGDKIEALPDNTTAKLTGKLRLLSGVVDKVNQDNDNITVDLQFLPYLESLHLTEVEIDLAEVDITAVAQVLADTAINISNRLIKIFETDLLLETNIPVYPIFKNPSGELSGPDEIDFRFTSNNLKSPFKVNGLSVLVGENSLQVILDAKYIGFEGTQEELMIEKQDEPEKDLKSARTAFKKIWTDSFSDNSPTAGTKVVISKPFIAFTLNNLLNQSKACVAANTERPQTLEIAETLTLPPASNIECKPDAECKQRHECKSNRDCTYTAQKDTRPCNKCLIRNPFSGGCSLRGNDPVCEAAKAFQNAAYQADASARKLDCERIKAQKKGECEGKKAVNKGFCELGKVAEKGVCETLKTGYQGLLVAGDDIAHADGNASVNSDIQVCVSQFVVDDKLTNLALTWNLSGQASVDFSLTLKADGIAKLGCPIPVYPKGKLKVTVINTPVTIDSKLDITNGEKGFGLSYTGQVGEIPYRLDPDPVSFILDLWGLEDSIGCPIFAPAAVASQVANVFNVKFSNELSVDAKSFNGFESWKLPEIEIGGHKLELEAMSTARSIMIKGLWADQTSALSARTGH